MATVYISKTFLSDVEALINNMASDDVRFKFGSNRNAVDLSQFSNRLRFLENLAWPKEHIEQAVTMPERWKKRNTRASVRVHYFQGGVERKVDLECININGATWFPPDFNAYGRFEVVEDALTMLHGDPQYPEARVIYEKFLTARDATALEQKWHNTKREVTNFFAACPSVNKALLLQPAMQMYVPRQYLDKIKRVEAAKVVREVPTIDAATLAAQAVEVSIARSINGGSV